jgi:hypothetical protein
MHLYLLHFLFEINEDTYMSVYLILKHIYYVKEATGYMGLS